ncbi:zinc-binding dehydrogenase [Actinopolymorpha alba]|uniref:zinc-binding dehydrogenase n=1 Tax=Actinopolymorpha alba TaxID=533267 RepID=UPI0003642758|nr:zinc-binding dehydrogenase [Actinopolymorpha alba]
MRAIQAIAFGGPEVLVPTEVPDPVAGPGQVVVDVAVADTLFVETQIRRGGAGKYFTVTPPYVPGGAVAGRVRAVGAGADPGWIGRQVATRTIDFGGYAEQALAAVEALIRAPEGLDLQVAAALLHDGTTAFGLVEAADIRPTEWVLVTGAGGGLGVLLVQLAHAAGARVIGAARGTRKLDLLAGLGADAVVDYSEPSWPECVRAATGGAGVDVVFDGVGGEIGLAAFDLTAPGARFSAHGSPAGGFAVVDPVEAERRGVTVRGIEQVRFGPEDAKRLAERALTEAAAGRIKPVIGQTFPLERAADAHAAIEARAVTGKTLLLVSR